MGRETLEGYGIGDPVVGTGADGRLIVFIISNDRLLY
jgi:hypothetical protein